MSKATTESEAEKTFITVDVTQLINHGGELGDALVNFLTEKLPKDITVSRAENEVYIRSNSPYHPSKTQLRVYLKRFLHLNALRGDLKIISQGKDRFVIIEYVTVVYVEE